MLDGPAGRALLRVEYAGISSGGVLMLPKTCLGTYQHMLSHYMMGMMTHDVNLSSSTMFCFIAQKSEGET